MVLSSYAQYVLKQIEIVGKEALAHSNQSPTSMSIKMLEGTLATTLNLVNKLDHLNIDEQGIRQQYLEVSVRVWQLDPKSPATFPADLDRDLSPNAKLAGREVTVLSESIAHFMSQETRTLGGAKRVKAFADSLSPLINRLNERRPDENYIKGRYLIWYSKVLQIYEKYGS